MKNNILREAAEKQRSGEEYYMEFLNEVFVTLVRSINPYRCFCGLTSRGRIATETER